MKKSGSKAFAQNLKRLKGKGAWAVRPNGIPLFFGSINNIPRGFTAEHTVKTQCTVKLQSNSK
jgi:hypothetical protein